MSIILILLKTNFVLPSQRYQTWDLVLFGQDVTEKVSLTPFGKVFKLAVIVVTRVIAILNPLFASLPNTKFYFNQPSSQGETDIRRFALISLLNILIATATKCTYRFSLKKKKTQKCYKFNLLNLSQSSQCDILLYFPTNPRESNCISQFFKGIKVCNHQVIWTTF